MGEDKSNPIEGVTWTVLGFSILAMFGILGWEAYQWLKFGDWPNIKFVIVFEYLGVNLDWAYYPTSWIGAAKVIRWFLSWPLSLTLPVFAPGLTYIFGSILYSLLEEIKSSMKIDKNIKKE